MGDSRHEHGDGGADDGSRDVGLRELPGAHARAAQELRAVRDLALLTDGALLTQGAGGAPRSLTTAAR